MIYINEKTDAINLFESAICAVYFDHAKSKITFELDWTEGYGRFIIECIHCTKIDFEVRSINDNLWDGLLITGFSYLKHNDNYTIQFNFGLEMEGYLRLSCDEFSFNVPSSPLQAGGNNHLIDKID